MVFSPEIPRSISHFHSKCQSVAEGVKALHDKYGHLEKRYHWFGGKSYYDPNTDCYYTAQQINEEIKNLIKDAERHSWAYSGLGYLGTYSFKTLARGNQYVLNRRNSFIESLETEACRVHTVHNAKARVDEAISQLDLKDLAKKLASDEEFYEEQGWAPLAWWIFFLNAVAEFFDYYDVSDHNLDQEVANLTKVVTRKYGDLNETIEECCTEVITRGSSYANQQYSLDREDRVYHAIHGDKKSACILSEALGGLKLRSSDLPFAPSPDSPYFEAFQRKFNTSNYTIKYHNQRVYDQEDDISKTIDYLHKDLKATLISTFFDDMVRKSENNSSYSYRRSFRLLAQSLDKLETKMATLKQNIKAKIAQEKEKARKERERKWREQYSYSHTGRDYSRPPRQETPRQTAPPPRSAARSRPVNIFGASYPVPVFTQAAGDYLETRDSDLHMRFRMLSAIPKTDENECLRARITLGVNDANGVGLTKRRVVVAYRKLTLRWHPDKASGKPEEIKELHTQVSAVINHANDVLLEEFEE